MKIYATFEIDIDDEFFDGTYQFIDTILHEDLILHSNYIGQEISSNIKVKQWNTYDTMNDKNKLLLKLLRKNHYYKSYISNSLMRALHSGEQYIFDHKIPMSINQKLLWVSDELKRYNVMGKCHVQR